jgi:UPF0755 protein
MSPTTVVRAAAQRVILPPDHGVLDIAHRLREEGVIRSALGFSALAVLRGTARQLKAGEYEIPRDASALTILELIESGRVVQRPVLFPEGSSMLEIAAILEDAGLASAHDVMRLARDAAFLKQVGVEASSLEGYLFPDTYFLTLGSSPEHILARMVQRLRTKITPDMLARARARGMNLHELLTLASIVEREAVVPEETRLISAVFWNRLEVDMPLQADPTVQYAVGKERQALTRADLLTDDPYNTYRRPGLPPGPIASPGLVAIEAVLDPAPVDYLYFVSIDERRHFFSTTAAQHNAAVARYRVAPAR